MTSTSVTKFTSNRCCFEAKDRDIKALEKSIETVVGSVESDIAGSIVCTVKE